MSTPTISERPFFTGLSGKKRARDKAELEVNVKSLTLEEPTKQFARNRIAIDERALNEVKLHADEPQRP